MGRRSRIKQELRLTPVIIQMNIPEELLVDMLFHIASDGKEYHAIIDFGNIESEHMVQYKYVLVAPIEFVTNAQP